MAEKIVQSPCARICVRDTASALVRIASATARRAGVEMTVRSVRAPYIAQTMESVHQVVFAFVWVAFPDSRVTSAHVKVIVRGVVSAIMGPVSASMVLQEMIVR